MHPDAGQAAVVERLLSMRMGRPVRVLRVQPLGGAFAPVARMTLDTRVTDPAGEPQGGATVVVKARRRGGTGWGYDPANLRNEQASLRLLEELGAGVAPRLLAADDGAGILVMTDAGAGGAGPSVEDLVHARGPNAAAAARGALTGLARAVGAMHAASLGRDGDYHALRAALGSGDPAHERRGHLTPERWGELCASVAALGFPRAERASDDVRALAAELGEPGPLLALTHQDLTPANGVLAEAGGRADGAGGRVVLVDFEGAAFRHLCLDAAQLRFPFPQYGRWAPVPDGVVDGMLAAYRDDLARGWPPARDDRAFDAVLAAGCAAWAVIRTYRLPRVSDDGQPPEQARRRRAQLLHTIDVFLATAGRAGRFAELAAWLSDLAGAMRGRWPADAEPAFPTFPAFAPAGI